VSVILYASAHDPSTHPHHPAAVWRGPSAPNRHRRSWGSREVHDGLRDLRGCRKHATFRFSIVRAPSEPWQPGRPEPKKVDGARSTTRAMWVAATWARTVGEVCLKPKREARLVPRLLFRNAMPFDTLAA
jgi:hypothetical protein